MTPDPSSAKPTYALPTVALVLSILGVCFCPLALVGAVLGLVAVLRIGKEPQLPGKGVAIAAMVVPVGLVPIMGIMAAIAIPNFIKFQSRSKQAECKVQLRALWTAAKMARADSDRWPDKLEGLGFNPDPRNRYSYFLSPSEAVAASSELGQGSVEEHAAALQERGIAIGVNGEAFTAACVGNIDNDPTLDIWTVSSEPKTDANGATVQPGTPVNVVNDVSE